MDRQNYIYGNTVRREEYYEIPDIYSKEEIESVKRNREREKTLSIDLPYLILLIAACVAALFIFYNYLKVQSSITTTLKNIEAQEARLAELKSENDALETRIETSINLDYVYSVATKKLGMVYAKKDQVITYDRTENEYVRQYDDIP